MTGRDDLSGAALDRLLGRLPDPEVPPGLAQRIAAAAGTLPQHRPREEIIALAAPAPRSLGQQAFGQRMAGLSAFAAAACVLMLLWPLGMRPPVTPAVPSHTASAKPLPEKQAAPPPTQLAKATPPVTIKPALVPETRQNFARPDHTEHAKPVEPVGTPMPWEQEKLAEVLPSEAAPKLADATKAADVAGPKAPVQGPPAPIDLSPAGRPATGLGVVGGGTGGGGIPRPR